MEPRTVLLQLFETNYILAKELFTDLLSKIPECMTAITQYLLATHASAKFMIGGDSRVYLVSLEIGNYNEVYTALGDTDLVFQSRAMFERMLRNLPEQDYPEIELKKVNCNIYEPRILLRTLINGKSRYLHELTQFEADEHTLSVCRVGHKLRLQWMYKYNQESHVVEIDCIDRLPTIRDFMKLIEEVIRDLRANVDKKNTTMTAIKSTPKYDAKVLELIKAHGEVEKQLQRMLQENYEPLNEILCYLLHKGESMAIVSDEKFIIDVITPDNFYKFGGKIRITPGKINLLILNISERLPAYGIGQFPFNGNPFNTEVENYKYLCYLLDAANSDIMHLTFLLLQLQKNDPAERAVVNTGSIGRLKFLIHNGTNSRVVHSIDLVIDVPATILDYLSLIKGVITKLELAGPKSNVQPINPEKQNTEKMDTTSDAKNSIKLKITDESLQADLLRKMYQEQNPIMCKLVQLLYELEDDQIKEWRIEKYGMLFGLKHEYGHLCLYQIHGDWYYHKKKYDINNGITRNDIIDLFLEAITIAEAEKLNYQRKGWKGGWLNEQLLTTSNWRREQQAKLDKQAHLDRLKQYPESLLGLIDTNELGREMLQELYDVRNVSRCTRYLHLIHYMLTKHITSAYIPLEDDGYYRCNYDIYNCKISSNMDEVCDLTLEQLTRIHGPLGGKGNNFPEKELEACFVQDDIFFPMLQSLYQSNNDHMINILIHVGNEHRGKRIRVGVMHDIMIFYLGDKKVYGIENDERPWIQTLMHLIAKVAGILKDTTCNNHFDWRFPEEQNMEKQTTPEDVVMEDSSAPVIPVKLPVMPLERPFDPKTNYREMFEMITKHRNIKYKISTRNDDPYLMLRGIKYRINADIDECDENAQVNRLCHMALTMADFTDYRELNRLNQTKIKIPEVLTGDDFQHDDNFDARYQHECRLQEILSRHEQVEEELKLFFPKLHFLDKPTYHPRIAHGAQQVTVKGWYKKPDCGLFDIIERQEATGIICLTPGEAIIASRDKLHQLLQQTTAWSYYQAILKRFGDFELQDLCQSVSTGGTNLDFYQLRYKDRTYQINDIPAELFQLKLAEKLMLRVYCILAQVEREESETKTPEEGIFIEDLEQFDAVQRHLLREQMVEFQKKWC